MANIVSVFFVMVMAVTCLEIGVGNAALSMKYYKFSCPFVDSVVKNHLQRALHDDPTLAAGLVRMHFHDCFIQVTFSLTLSLIHFYFIFKFRLILIN